MPQHATEKKALSCKYNASVSSVCRHAARPWLDHQKEETKKRMPNASPHTNPPVVLSLLEIKGSSQGRPYYRNKMLPSVIVQLEKYRTMTSAYACTKNEYEKRKSVFANPVV